MKHAFFPRFVNGTFWAFVGTLVAQIFGMAVSIITARALGKIGFGEYGIVINTIGTFGIVAGLGLGLTTTKFVAEYKTEQPHKAGQILGLSFLIGVISGGVGSIVVFLGANYMATRILGAPQLRYPIQVSAILVLLNTMIGIQTGALSGFEAFWAIAKIKLIVSIAEIPLIIFGVVLYHLNGALYVIVAISALNYYLNSVELRKQCGLNGASIQYAGLRERLPIVWTYAFPAFLSGILGTIFIWISNTLLVNHANGYAEMGILSAANQWKMVISFLPGVVSSVAIPILASEVSDGKGSLKFPAAMEMNHGITVTAIVPISVVMMLGSSYIMSLYGADFSQGYRVLLWMIFGLSVSSVGNAAGNGLQALGKMWLGALLNLVWGSAYILVVIVLVARSGALALSVATAIAYSILTMLGYIYLYKMKIVTSAMIRRVYSAFIFILVIAYLGSIVDARVGLVLALPLGAIALLFGLKYWLPEGYFGYARQSLSKLLLSRRGA